MTDFRKAGAEILKVLQSATDPVAVAGSAIIYAKDDGSGAIKTFIRSSDGAIAPVGAVSGGSVAPFSGALVYPASGFSVPTSTNTLLTFSAENFDTDNYHSTVSNTGRLTAPTTGYYNILATFDAASGTGGSGAQRTILQIRKNAAGAVGGGTRLSITVSALVAQDFRMNCNAVALLQAGDYVEVFAYQDSGTTWVTTADVATSFSMVRLQAEILPQSGVSVYDSTPLQSIANATWVPLAYNAELFDTANYHSTLTNTTRLVAPVTGYYLITGTISFAINTTGQRYLQLYKNGGGTLSGGTILAYEQAMPNTGGIETKLQCTTVAYLTAGEYVELYAHQTSGGALNVSKDVYFPFQLILISGTNQTGSTAPSGASVYHSTTQNVTSAGAGLTVLYDSEEFDTDNYHSVVANTSRLTAPQTGYYLVGARVYFSANSTGIREISIVKNGTTTISDDKRTSPTAVGVAYVETQTIHYFQAGDYITVTAYQDSGSTLTLGTPTYCPFQMMRLQGAAPSSVSPSAASGVSVIHSTTQSHTTATWLLMTFDTEVFDTADYHSTVTNPSRLIAPVTGYYYARGAVDWATNSSGARHVAIGKNPGGTISNTFAYRSSPGIVNNRTVVEATGVVFLTAGDYVELFAYQDSGSTLAVSKTSDTPFQLVLLQGGSQAFTGASAHSNVVAQTIPNSVDTALTFGFETYDTAGMHDTVTNNSRITISTSGYYYVSASALFNANATGVRQITVRKNGTTGVAFGRAMYSVAASIDTQVSAQAVAYLVAGDYIEAVVNQNSGGNLGVYTADYAPLTAVLLSGGAAGGGQSITATSAAATSTNFSTLGNVDWLFLSGSSANFPRSLGTGSLRQKRTGGVLSMGFTWTANGWTTGVTNTSGATWSSTATDDLTATALSTTTVQGMNTASIYNNTPGFQLLVPTFATTRVLRIYTMVFNANVTLDAKLLDGSGTVTISASTAGAANDERVWTITYASQYPTWLSVNVYVTDRNTAGNANCNLFCAGASIGTV